MKKMGEYKLRRMFHTMAATLPLFFFHTLVHDFTCYFCNQDYAFNSCNVHVCTVVLTFAF